MLYENKATFSEKLSKLLIKNHCDASEKQGDRFYQNIRVMEECNQGQ